MGPMGISYIGLAAAIVLGVAGQIALKSGVAGTTGFVAMLLNLRTIVGLGIYFLAALCYLVALKRIPVSIAFPSVAASYAVVGVLAHVLWNEPFGWAQIAGILLIGGGVLLINQH